jgi:hypothetical protein
MSRVQLPIPKGNHSDTGGSWIRPNASANGYVDPNT